jgi:hypothetical protein
MERSRSKNLAARHETVCIDNKEHFSRGVARKGVGREDSDGGGATVRAKCVGRN